MLLDFFHSDLGKLAVLAANAQGLLLLLYSIGLLVTLEVNMGISGTTSLTNV